MYSKARPEGVSLIVLVQSIANEAPPQTDEMYSDSVLVHVKDGKHTPQGTNSS